MSKKRNWFKWILELGEHTEFIAHWIAEAAKYAVGPAVLGLIAAIWAAVKGWDSLWIGLAAMAAIAVTLLFALIIFLIVQIRRLRNSVPSTGISFKVEKTTTTITPTTKIITTTSSTIVIDEKSR